MAEKPSRNEMQPALLKAAEAFCIYRLTDGFCHPRNAASCRCWDSAGATMAATGLSANAIAWIMQHATEIEERASRPAAEKETNDG